MTNPRTRMLHNSRGDITPDPDPTNATKEFVRDAVEAAITPLSQELRGQQKAVELLATNQAREPQASQVANSVVHLKEIHISELNGLRKEVSGVKELFEQSVESFRTLVEKINELNDKALKVLFDVNDKASLKSEASFRTQLEELGKRLELMSGGLTEKVAALDKRITTGEGNKQGFDSGTKLLISILGLLISAGLFANAFFHH